jgi:hypothetical protein
VEIHERQRRFAPYGSAVVVVFSEIRCVRMLGYERVIEKSRSTLSE